jgi:hypothetical protein
MLEWAFRFLQGSGEMILNRVEKYCLVAGEINLILNCM